MSTSPTTPTPPTGDLALLKSGNPIENISLASARTVAIRVAKLTEMIGRPIKITGYFADPIGFAGNIPGNTIAGVPEAEAVSLYGANEQDQLFWVFTYTIEGKPGNGAQSAGTIRSLLASNSLYFLASLFLNLYYPITFNAAQALAAQVAGAALAEVMSIGL